MSELYEVAFYGEIAEGANPDQVKTNIAKMFKADENKLAHLFSGKRIIIKKNIDEQTARKYQVAIKNAGAVCEIKNLAQADTPPASTTSAEPVAQPAAPQTIPVSKSDYSDHDIPPAPQTVPLDITGDQISDLNASVAPVGSDMQDMVEEAVAPPPVPEGITLAPVGSDLAEHEEKSAPPIPDTSGMSIIDN